MNNDRRKRLTALTSPLEDIKGLLEEIRDEEQEAFDNMPESLQDGERGQAMQTAIDSLDQALEDLSSVVETVEEVAA